MRIRRFDKGSAQLVRDGNVRDTQVKRVVCATMKTFPGKRKTLECHMYARIFVADHAPYLVRQPAKLDRPLRQPPCDAGQKHAAYDQAPDHHMQRAVRYLRADKQCPS